MTADDPTEAEYLAAERARFDYAAVAALVPPRAKVLELGCGDGELLKLLEDTKKITARGVEISEEGVAACVAKGLSVYQGNIDEGLKDYKDGRFDCVVSIRTVQVVRHPKKVILEMTRVGRQAIISFPNFGHLSVRLWLLFRGRMPKSRFLPYEWYDTPNIHLLSIRDFRRFCRQMDLVVEREMGMPDHPQRFGLLRRLWPNLFAHYGLFVIRRKG